MQRSHTTCFELAAAATVLLLPVAGAIAADWAMYRGPDHNGISAETGWFDPSAKVKVLWSKQVGTGFSSVSVAGGRAYTTGNSNGKDTVFCFNAGSGREIWKFSYACGLGAKYYEGGTHATPTIDGDRVYTFSKYGHLFALDAAKGAKIWGIKVQAKPPTWGFAGSPLVLGNLLIVNAGPAGMAFNKNTGKVVWQSGTGVSGYSTPVPFERGGETLIALFAAKSVIVVRAGDGKKVWEHPWQTKYSVNAADPVVAGDTIFISSGYNRGCSLLRIGKGKIWENKNMRTKMYGCVLLKDRLYGCDTGGSLRCLDIKTGKKLWSHKGMGMGTQMVADGKLIVLSERGKLIIGEPGPSGLKELASGQVVSGRCWSVPVLANGLIYARSSKGNLACVSVGKK